MTSTKPSAPAEQTESTSSAALHVGTSDPLTLVMRNLRQSGIYIAFIVIVALFASLTHGVLLSPGNITNIVL